MGGKIKITSPAAKHVKQLDALEQTLAKTSDASALGKLAIEFHMVVYRLGHDIPAMMALPELADRATRGKIAANDKASSAYAADGNIKHAVFHLFEALEAGPSRADIVRLGERVATLLDDHGPNGAKQMRACIAKLARDDEKARDTFAQHVEQLKYAFDWERLPKN
jgi:hypothetical protein